MRGSGFTIDDIARSGKRTAVVVAHQDDESIGFSAVLRACPNALMVHVTDGAPENPAEWKDAQDREAYAALRAHEAAAALDVANHTGPRVSLGIRDTRAPWHIADIIRHLIAAFERHEVGHVCTHAFEGGHPDHDAVAFAVHTAAERTSAVVIEAPFYRATPGGSAWQSFVPDPERKALKVVLDEQGRRIKQQMLRAHASQAAACAHADPAVEYLRLPPAYDFAALPHTVSRKYALADIDAIRWRQLIEAVS